MACFEEMEGREYVVRRKTFGVQYLRRCKIPFNRGSRKIGIGSDMVRSRDHACLASSSSMPKARHGCGDVAQRDSQTRSRCAGSDLILSQSQRPVGHVLASSFAFLSPLKLCCEHSRLLSTIHASSSTYDARLILAHSDARPDAQAISLTERLVPYL